MYVANRVLNNFLYIKDVNQVVHRCRHFVQKHKRRIVDPGIQQRKSLIKDEESFEQLNDYDFDLEADFMNVGESYDEHIKELVEQQKQKQYLIVKQKYFKEKMPNFLTWNDKEQIRYLHHSNPEEWPIEKLSEGFPAMPDVIAKILKATWTKKTEYKIQNHDKSVQENWKLFKEGKFPHLDDNLVAHLKRFSNRELNLRPVTCDNTNGNNCNQTLIAPNIKIKPEFSEIISSYERLKKKSDMSEIPNVGGRNKIGNPPKEGTYILSNNKLIQSKHITLSKLEDKILNKDQDKLLADEKLLFEEIKQKQQEQNVQENQLQSSKKVIQFSSIIQKKYTENKLSVKQPDKKDYLLIYPEKICIPKDKLKKGCTYKLNDCYYDDDGEFLYRVPGIY